MRRFNLAIWRFNHWPSCSKPIRDISPKMAPCNLCVGMETVYLASPSTHSSGSLWFITVLIQRGHWPDWNITSAVWWITVNFATDSDAPRRATVKDVVYETVDGGVLSPTCQTLWASEGVKNWCFWLMCVLTIPLKASTFNGLATKHFNRFTSY